MLFPEIMATTRAICVTTAERTLTRVVIAGIITSTSGCASVSNAPLNCAIALVASSLVLITFDIHARTLRKAAVITVNTNTLCASLETLTKSFSIFAFAIAVASPNLLVLNSASSMLPLNSCALFLASSRSIFAVLNLLLMLSTLLAVRLNSD